MLSKTSRLTPLVSMIIRCKLDKDRMRVRIDATLEDSDSAINIECFDSRVVHHELIDRSMRMEIQISYSDTDNAISSSPD